LSKKDAESFETGLEKLEGIVEKLERGDLSLEKSLELYEEGIRLSRMCHERLQDAEGKIELLMKNARGDLEPGAAGEPRSKPFEPGSDGETA